MDSHNQDYRLRIFSFDGSFSTTAQYTLFVERGSTRRRPRRRGARLFATARIDQLGWGTIRM